MVQSRRRVGGVFVVLSLALTAGCQQGPPWLAWWRPRGDEMPRLRGAQVADVQVAMGRTLEKRGDVDRALTAYAEAAKQDPGRADALARMAVLCDRQGKFRDSEELYRRALAAQPNNPDLHCNRGYSLYLQQRWTEAEASLRRAIALRPDHPQAHNNLGLVLARLNRGEEALEAFHRAGCNEAGAHANLAYGRMLAGDWPEARRHYEKALAADPSAQPARKGLQALVALESKVGAGQPALADAGQGGSSEQTSEVIQASFPSPAAPPTLQVRPKAPAERQD